MAQMKALLVQTFNANGAINSKFRFLVFTAEYTVGLAGAGARAIGVNIDTAPSAGRGLAVVTQGTVKVEAGAAVAAGALVAPDATGRAITATGGAQYSARALQAATAAGDIIECELESGTA